MVPSPVATTSHFMSWPPRSRCRISLFHSTAPSTTQSRCGPVSQPCHTCDRRSPPLSLPSAPPNGSFCLCLPPDARRVGWERDCQIVRGGCSVPGLAPGAMIFRRFGAFRATTRKPESALWPGQGDRATTRLWGNRPALLATRLQLQSGSQPVFHGSQVRFRKLSHLANESLPGRRTNPIDDGDRGSPRTVDRHGQGRSSLRTGGSLFRGPCVIWRSAGAAPTPNAPAPETGFPRARGSPPEA